MDKVGKEEAQWQTDLDRFLSHIVESFGIEHVKATITVQGCDVVSSVRKKEVRRPVDPRKEPLILGCAVKLLVAAIVTELAIDKVIDIHVPIKEYIPELKRSNHGKSITISHLLSHTSGYSGIGDVSTIGSLPDLINHLLISPQHFVPGTVYSYDHAEAVIAGDIIRRVTGRSVRTLFREILFSPDNCQELNKYGLPRTSSGNGALEEEDHTGIWDPAFSNLRLSYLDAHTLYMRILGRKNHDINDVSASCRYSSELTAPSVEIPTMLGGVFANQSPSFFGIGVALWSDGFSGISGSYRNDSFAFRYNASLSAGVSVVVTGSSTFVRDLIMDRICESLCGARRGAFWQYDNLDYSRIEGFYLGPKDSTVKIIRSDDGATLFFRFPGGIVFNAIMMRKEDGIAIRSPVRHLYIGFIRPSYNHDWVLVVGGVAFKKVF